MPPGDPPDKLAAGAFNGRMQFRAGAGEFPAGEVELAVSPEAGRRLAGRERRPWGYLPPPSDAMLARFDRKFKAPRGTDFEDAVQLGLQAPVLFERGFVVNGGNGRVAPPLAR